MRTNEMTNRKAKAKNRTIKQLSKLYLQSTEDYHQQYLEMVPGGYCPDHCLTCCLAFTGRVRVQGSADASALGPAPSARATLPALALCAASVGPGVSGPRVQAQGVCGGVP